MKALALTPAQQRRLESLARDAGRTPKQMMRFVLRDGFEFCEWEVRAGVAAQADARKHGWIAHEAVMRDAQRVIDAGRARKARKAA
jgi:predicted transcriptional regulator